MPEINQRIGLSIMLLLSSWAGRGEGAEEHCCSVVLTDQMLSPPWASFSGHKSYIAPSWKKKKRKKCGSVQGSITEAHISNVPLQKKRRDFWMSGTIHNSRLDSGDQELVDSWSREWEFSTGEFYQGLRYMTSVICVERIWRSQIFLNSEVVLFSLVSKTKWTLYGHSGALLAD